MKHLSFETIGGVVLLIFFKPVPSGLNGSAKPWVLSNRVLGFGWPQLFGSRQVSAKKNPAEAGFLRLVFDNNQFVKLSTNSTSLATLGGM